MALAMDAFAVAASVSISIPQWSARHTFRLSWYFGVFQAGTFLTGGLGGKVVSTYIDKIDHWVAFAVLMLLGSRMFAASFRSKDNISYYDPTRGLRLYALSIATSIDALAVGVSLGLLAVSLWIPALVVGFVAFVLTSVACRLGRFAGAHMGRWAYRLAGAALLGIGSRILYQHLNPL